MSFYYDKEGNPIDSVLEWAELLGNPDYKVIAQDIVGDDWVSTVWLGLDHGFGLQPLTPIIFETMVFANGKADDFYTRRYSTLEEAKQGHEETLKLLTQEG